MADKKSTIVRMRNFNFTYQNSQKENLSGINLEIQEGEVVLLTGPSGCGKTTLTKCMNGLIPDFFEGKISGSCEVFNMDIAKHETGDYSPYVGSVFQDPRSQFFTMHVKTELVFPAENLSMPRQQMQEKLKDTIHFFELEKLLDHSIFQLSSGEKQKVAVASSYIAGVKLFVLDEPSANMDALGTWRLRNIIQKLKKAGYTIVISEHKLYYLKDLVDQVIILRNGKIQQKMSGEAFSGKSSEWFTDNGFRQLDLSNIKPDKHNKMRYQEKPILEVEDLSFWYNHKKPLWQGISFEGTRGDIIGIIGSNGAGKSTLFRVLMGLEKPKRGRIFINGKKANKRKRRQTSSYVMQDVDYQLFASTVLDEMLLESKDVAQDKQRALELLEYFGLSAYQNIHPSMLSGGQKQRLSIAMAYMRQTDILFLDEPTSGLDGENMRLVCDAIQKLADKGCLIFIITHDYEFAAKTLRSLLIIKEHAVSRISEENYHPESLYALYQSKEQDTDLEVAAPDMQNGGVEIA